MIEIESLVKFKSITDFCSTNNDPHIKKSKATNILLHVTGDVLISVVSIVHIFEDNFQSLLTCRPLLELDRAIVCYHC